MELQGSDLVSVQVVFRHGERTYNSQEKIFVNNASKNLQEPYGYGRLTAKGMYQEYRIGEMLRERYGHFIGEVYKPENLYARASDYDRTKASLQLVLAALYSPKGKLTWSKSLNWMPIPYDFVPRPLDVIFNQASCPAYINEYRRVIKSDEMKEHVAEYDDLIELFTQEYPDVRVNLLTLFFINNYLTIQRSLNGPMPNWYTPARHQKLIKAGELYLDSMYCTPFLLRNAIGGLMSRIVDNMNANGEKVAPRKLYLYSGHEYTVYGVAKAHGINLAQSPAYGSAIIIENWNHRRTGRNFVKMYYYEGKGTSEKPKLLKVGNYGEICPLDSYIELTKPSIASKEELDCLLHQDPNDLLSIITKDDLSQ